MVRSWPQRLRIGLIGFVQCDCPVRCLQCAHLSRRGRLGFRLRDRRGCGDCCGCNLLNMGGRLRHGRGRVALLLGALHACCAGLLALLVTAATPSASPAAPFALLAGFARLLRRLWSGSMAGGFAVRGLALGRLRPLMLAPVTPACILLRMALILSAAPAITLSLQLLGLRALVALASRTLSARLITASSLALTPLMAPAARPAIGCRHRGGGRALLSLNHGLRPASEQPENLADDRPVLRLCSRCCDWFS